ncbi:MAG: hypothetical protein QOH51_233 [Acidobacteriota bacterium]|jgi:hypothetical protein|nr:hypothetical protein [Acidobacteriota bacterium]
MKNSSDSFLAVGLTLLMLAFNGCGQPSNTNDKANAPQVVASNGNSGAAPSADVAATSAAPSPTPGAQGDSTVGSFAPPSASERAQAHAAPAPPAAPAKTGPQPKTQIGSGGNDFYLFTQARGTINADSELQNAGIVIEVRDGVATLTGAVPDDARRQKAARLVEGVAGIKSVKNKLRVAAK